MSFIVSGARQLARDGAIDARCAVLAGLLRQSKSDSRLLDLARRNLSTAVGATEMVKDAPSGEL